MRLFAQAAVLSKEQKMVGAQSKCRTQGARAGGYQQHEPISTASGATPGEATLVNTGRAPADTLQRRAVAALTRAPSSRLSLNWSRHRELMSCGSSSSYTALMCWARGLALGTLRPDGWVASLPPGSRVRRPYHARTHHTHARCESRHSLPSAC